MTNSSLIGRVPRWMRITIIAFIVSAVGLKSCMYYRQLSFAPKGLGIWRVIYVKEEEWGFGPGGNETGVIVYELPADAAEQISKHGLSYLSELHPVMKGRSWHGIYTDWHTTPIDRKHKEWFENPSTKKMESKAKIKYYLDLYGFGIKIRSDISIEIDETISALGNFYAYGRIGVIIVAPSIRKVFYVYVG